MHKKHKKVIAFIKTVRESFHDSYIVFSYGGCYGFYQILKFVFPEAKAYFANNEEGHIYTKIGDTFYDIKGKKYSTDKTLLLSREDHERWVGVANGQRLEFMLAKYRDHELNLKEKEK